MFIFSQLYFGLHVSYYLQAYRLQLRMQIPYTRSNAISSPFHHLLNISFAKQQFVVIRTIRKTEINALLHNWV